MLSGWVWVNEWVRCEMEKLKVHVALVIIFAAGVIKLPTRSFGNYTDKLATRTMAQKSNKWAEFLKTEYYNEWKRMGENIGKLYKTVNNIHTHTAIYYYTNIITMDNGLISIHTVCHKKSLRTEKILKKYSKNTLISNINSYIHTT